MNRHQNSGRTISRLAILRGGILAAALGLIAAGIFTGDYLNVYLKAIRICFECIGIG